MASAAVEIAPKVETAGEENAAVVAAVAAAAAVVVAGAAVATVVLVAVRPETTQHAAEKSADVLGMDRVVEPRLPSEATHALLHDERGEAAAGVATPEIAGADAGEFVVAVGVCAVISVAWLVSAVRCDRRVPHLRA